MNLKCNPKDFQVPPIKGKAHSSDPIDLPTHIKPLYDSKKNYKKLLKSYTEEMISLQKTLYAHNSYALLLIFQGMDTAGKDGAIRHVMSGVNPQGCQVQSFKQPSHEELEHDFLWRAVKHLPLRGNIGIFNRSYYEEVLIVKAVPAVLAAQNLPQECVNHKYFWRDRYRDIISFEEYLARNGTRILKFFLHLSKEEQRQRLLSRANNPDKQWKISPEDLKSRAQWDDYQKVYGECLNNTSHKTAPWHVIPADDKRNARLVISHIIVEALRALPIRFPKPDKKQLEEVKRVKAALQDETKKSS